MLIRVLITLIAVVFIQSTNAQLIDSASCRNTVFRMHITSGAGTGLELKDVETTHDGGFLLAAVKDVGGNKSSVLIKTDNAGNILYSKTLKAENRDLHVMNLKIHPDGRLLIAGVFADNAADFFLSILNADASSVWLQKFNTGAVVLHTAIEYVDTASVVMAAQTATQLYVSRFSEAGAHQFSRLFSVPGMTKLAGISNMYRLSGMGVGNIGVVVNCFRNNKYISEIFDLDKATGKFQNSGSSEMSDIEMRTDQTTGFLYRLYSVGIVKQGGKFYVDRNIAAHAMYYETKRRYIIPTLTGFNATTAMDNAADALSLVLPDEGRMIMLKEYNDQQNWVGLSFFREYPVPSGAINRGMVRSFDGGWLMALNSKNNDSIILIKTDSIGRSGNCQSTSINLDYQFLGSSQNKLTDYPPTAVSLIGTAAPVISGSASMSASFDCQQFLCAPAPSKDDCLPSYQKIFRSNSFRDQFMGVFVMKDRKLITHGVRTDRILGTTHLFNSNIRLHANNGEVLKAKRLYYSSGAYLTYAYSPTDSTVVLMSRSTENKNVAYTFTLLDANLNEKWTKTHVAPEGFVSSTARDQLHCDTEGNFYFVTASAGAANKKGFTILKLDPQGDRIWTKAFIHGYSSFYSAAIAVTTRNNELMVIADGAVICRIEKNTGAIISYHVSLIGGGGDPQLVFFHDRYLYAADNYDSPSFVVLDAAGKPIKARYSYSGLGVGPISIYNGKMYALATRAAGLGKVRTGVFAVDSTLEIKLFGPEHELSFGTARGIDIDDDGNIYRAGHINGGQSNLETDSYLMKMTAKGEMSGCDKETVNPNLQPIIQGGNTATYAISIDELSFTNGVTTLALVTDSLPQRTTMIACGAAQVHCTSVQLTGASSVCGTGTPMKFSFITNGACTLAPEWKIDTAYAQIVSSGSDHVMIRFKKIGATTIGVKISGTCVPVTDQTAVSIADADTQLELGNNTELCTGNSMVLHAGVGFQTYVWNNNSNDSVLQVNAPGKYYVSVKDACNNLLSDTIVISQALLPSLQLPDSVTICNKEVKAITAAGGFASYNWTPNYQLSSNNSASVNASPLQDTSYIVTAEKSPGCIVKDTVRVRVYSSPPVLLGKDTVLCSGRSIPFSVANNAFQQYAWSNGSTAGSVTVSSGGMLWVAATTAQGCVSKDTVMITAVQTPQFDLGKDTVLCAGSSLLLNPGVTGNYTWQNNSHSNQLTASVAGSYSLTVDNSGCVFSDTLLLSYKPLPIAKLPADTILCDAATLTLNADANNTKNQWQDGTISNSIVVTTAGSYQLQSTLNGCNAADTIQISYAYSPTDRLTQTLSKCKEQIVLLNAASGTPDEKYLWQDQSTSPTFRANTGGSYTCTISNVCGTVTGTAIVKDIACECVPVVPNSFSPNGDGVNDRFVPQLGCDPFYYQITIFNRHGVVVFKSSDANKYWDGTSDGAPVPSGVYYYTLIARSHSVPENVRHSGYVTLLR